MNCFFHKWSDWSIETCNRWVYKSRRGKLTCYAVAAKEKRCLKCSKVKTKTRLIKELEM
jgi:hypothetical protein